MMLSAISRLAANSRTAALQGLFEMTILFVRNDDIWLLRMANLISQMARISLHLEASTDKGGKPRSRASGRCPRARHQGPATAAAETRGWKRLKRPEKALTLGLLPAAPGPMRPGCFRA